MPVKFSPKITVTILGSGTSFGVPQIGCTCNVCLSDNLKDKRYRASIKIEVDDNIFIIDAGPDFRTQLLRESTPYLSAVLLTHEHRDHVGGLDDLRAFNQLSKQPVEIYGLKRTINSVNQMNGYFSNSIYPGIPKFNFNEIQPSESFKINGTTIIPIEVLHNKLPILGYRIYDFTYITDASAISKMELNKIKGSKVLVINALRKEPYFSHFNLEQALAIIDGIKPEKAYLTHINHQMGLYDEINKELPAHIQLAFDELKINI